jgi:hypothetical protein
MTYDDPRDWDATRRASHLEELGLPLVATDDGTEVSFYRGVLIPWTTTLDTRITLVIDAIENDIPGLLVSAYAHKGSCSFAWLHEPPLPYTEGEGISVLDNGECVDNWVIDRSYEMQPSRTTNDLRRRNRRRLSREASTPSTATPLYSDYLQSDVWKRTRELALEYYGNACCVCNSRTSLDVHHRTYERLGHERLTDLAVLCRDHHATFHGKKA